MLRPRLTPCLLIHQNGLTKTVKFGAGKYVGDPINAVKIFNEKKADELIVLDIDATTSGKEPDYSLIRKLAAECRMPLCYGGGVSSLEQASRIVELGVEKVAVSSAAINRPDLVGEMASELGSQSVVVVLDTKRRRLGRKYDVWTHNAKRNTKLDPLELALKLQDAGAGEIVINSIESDGMMQGYDLALVRQIASELAVPITVLGGAGSLDHIKALYTEFGIIGAAAGSLFVFKGTYKAVLINYPTGDTKRALFPSPANKTSELA